MTTWLPFSKFTTYDIREQKFDDGREVILHDFRQSGITRSRNGQSHKIAFSTSCCKERRELIGWCGFTYEVREEKLDDDGNLILDEISAVWEELGEERAELEEHVLKVLLQKTERVEFGITLSMTFLKWTWKNRMQKWWRWRWWWGWGWWRWWELIWWW